MPIFPQEREEGWGQDSDPVLCQPCQGKPRSPHRGKQDCLEMRLKMVTYTATSRSSDDFFALPLACVIPSINRSSLV